MRKNRIVAAIWFAFIALVIIAVVAYVCYAAKYNPYFGNGS